jgi:hypothetical protein
VRSEKPWRGIGGVALAALFCATPVVAQGIPWSQHGTVSQRVGYTDIDLSYNRPVAHGRTLFGDRGLVHWGGIWHPGADSATTITFSRDVLIEGQPLKAGSYTLWTIPRPDSWTMIFSSAVHVFHIPYPGQASDVLRVEVKPEHGEHMEVLAYYFPVVAPDSAVLRLHWGEMVVPLHIRTTADQ